jgi:hypothetical protein
MQTESHAPTRELRSERPRGEKLASWQSVRDEERKRYMKIVFRFLLTRARQGMIIFIPEGSDEDPTRLHEYYGGTHVYFKSLGVEEL